MVVCCPEFTFSNYYELFFAAGIFVWVGKKITQQECAEAMSNGPGFAKKKGYPPNTNVNRVLDGGANKLQVGKRLKIACELKQNNTFLCVAGKIAKVAPMKFDASAFDENSKSAAKAGMVDDGSGTKTVYRFIDKEFVPVPHAEHEKFYGGDCYVINYQYKAGGTDQNIHYYWLVTFEIVHSLLNKQTPFYKSGLYFGSR